MENSRNDHEMVESNNEIVEIEASESGSTKIFRLNELSDEKIEDNAKDSVEAVEGDKSKDENTGNDAISEGYLNESSTSLLKRTLELFPVEI